MSAAPSPQEPGADLLDHLLTSLLDDFRTWFARGEVLLDSCPDTVMAAEQRQQLRSELQLARLELAAASALCQATDAPLALGLDTLAPWHQLVMRLWGLSARLRAQDGSLPPFTLPEPPPFPG